MVLSWILHVPSDAKTRMGPKRIWCENSRGPPPWRRSAAAAAPLARLHRNTFSCQSGRSNWPPASRFQRCNADIRGNPLTSRCQPTGWGPLPRGRPTWAVRCRLHDWRRAGNRPGLACRQWLLVATDACLLHGLAARCALSAFRPLLLADATACPDSAGPCAAPRRLRAMPCSTLDDQSRTCPGVRSRDTGSPPVVGAAVPRLGPTIGHHGHRRPRAALLLQHDSVSAWVEPPLGCDSA